MRSLRSRRLSGTIPIAILLAVTLGLAIQLADQAQNAVRRHRYTAEGVLRDYARLAAAEYTRRCGNFLDYYGVAPALAPVTRALEAGPQVPRPVPIEIFEGPGRKRPLELAQCNFRLDLHRADDPRRQAATPEPALRTSGEVLEPQLAGWLADTLVSLARGGFQPEWDHALVFGGPGRVDRMLAVALQRDSSGAPVAAYGLVVRPEAQRTLLQKAENIAPLLPETLTSGRDSLVVVRVLDPHGRELYAGEVHGASRFTARDTLGAPLGGLVCAATLRPEAAELLVIGGLPQSRLPQLLVLVGLTSLVLLATLLLLRREQELARVRTDFVSSVSHELRTPLAQIRMFAETLLLGRVRSPEEARRSLEIVDQEARRLTHLVENVLHVSRAERRILRLAPEPTPIAPLVRGVTDGFAPLAAARGMGIRLEVEPEIVTSADPGALRQILINLLDNAAKYGPEGQTVTVAAEAAGAHVRLRVDDEGPGVAVRERDRIWERFWRSKRRDGAGTPGAGIGLAVVRELVAMHGGRAWVEDAPGGGARFFVELPHIHPDLGAEPGRGG